MLKILKDLYDINEVALGSPTFQSVWIRNFPPLTHVRFSFKLNLSKECLHSCDLSAPILLVINVRRT
jgi:hypothetical protein